MELERKKALLVRACYYFLYTFAVFASLKWLWPLLLPFLLGFIIAYMLRPAANFIYHHSKISFRSASIICAIVFYILLGILFWILGAVFLLKIADFGAEAPRLYNEKIEPALSLINSKVLHLARGISPKLDGGQIYVSINGALKEIFISVSSWGGKLLTSLIRVIPMAILTIIFTIISSVLICADYKAVTQFIMCQIPKRLHKSILDMRDFLVVSLLKIIKAYLILMLLTFFLLCVGLWFLQIKNFAVYAAIISFLDLLPILGSGAVLIPWGIVLIVIGNKFTGVNLLLLWAISSFVRELMEPKILSGQIGLHPLMTLTSMYLGLKLTGFSGLILAPVACLLLCHMHNSGIIKLYNKPDDNIDIQ